MLGWKNISTRHASSHANVPNCNLGVSQNGGLPVAWQLKENQKKTLAILGFTVLRNTQAT